jgi:hypothetical protein
MIGASLGESLLLTRQQQRVRALHAAHDAVDGHEQIVMIFSCGDRKPSDHLGTKIPRIGLPCLALYPRMNAEERAARGFARWVAGCQCRSPDLV